MYDYICKVIARPLYVSLCFEWLKRQVQEDTKTYTPQNYAIF